MAIYAHMRACIGTSNSVFRALTGAILGLALIAIGAEARNSVKVIEVVPLVTKPKNPAASTQSIVVFTESSDEANDLIRNQM